MNKNPILARATTDLLTRVFCFRGGVSRRVGNMRAVTLAGQIVNTDRQIGIERAAQELERALIENTLDAQLESDRRAYELSDIALPASN